jgi:hypothetical protein
MIITKMALPRRTFLRGIGVTLALPLLDAMIPALSPLAKAAARPPRRFGCVYIGNGVAPGQWTPATEGANFTLPRILQPLEPLRNRLVVVTGLDNMPATAMGDGSGEHSRAGAAFLSAAHPKQTEGPDLRAGTTVDQIIAAEICKDTQLSSLELAMDNNNMAGSCEKGYTCAYENSISWRTPTMPLPMEINPRFAFERLFGSGGSAEERLARRRHDRSILDVVTKEVSRLNTSLGPRDSAKLSEYLDAIRDIEKRIEKVEAQNAIELPDRPLGIPNTVKEHAGLMFDLQVLAFQADITRVSSFMLAREACNVTYDEIGVAEGHHASSHHGGNPAKLAAYAAINTYHVQLFADFLTKLRATPDGDGTLLDHSLFLYGSGISDGNIHSHLDLPILVLGGAAGTIKGGRHIRTPKGTPLANLLLTLADKMGVPTKSIGDSTGELDLVDL